MPRKRKNLHPSSSDSEDEEPQTKHKKSDSNEPISLTQVKPFLIVPPPPQPAAQKRKGTGWIHPNLPQPPFTLIMVGPRKSGKSVTLRNLLDPNRYGSYGRAFKKSNIIFHSPTKDDDHTITSLNLKWVYGPEMDVTTLVNHIQSEQDSYKLQDDMADVLLVFDDATNTEHIWPIFTRLSHCGRHKGLHTIVVVHRLTATPRPVRLQAQQWMLFKPHEESEREWILYMFSRKTTRHIWMNAMNRAWNLKRFNFIYIDFERVGSEEIYRDGLNQSLFTDSELASLQQLEYGLGPKRPDAEGEDELPPNLIPIQPPQRKKRKR